MARQLRVQFPGAIYHVVTRGDGRRQIFHRGRFAGVRLAGGTLRGGQGTLRGGQGTLRGGQGTLPGGQGDASRGSG